MPMNVDALGAFAQINNATGRGIVQLALQNDGQLTKAGTYSSGRLLGRAIRSMQNERRNNATRESFLRSLAKALDVKVAGNNGKILLSPDLLDRIADKLDRNGDGSGAKLLGKSDFKIENGYVVSGCPLTERRITAIVNRVYENAHVARPGPQAGQDGKIGSLGANFNNELSHEIAALKDSGWNAATNASHRKLLAGVLSKMTQIPVKMLLSPGKEPKFKSIRDLFSRLWSRFASDGAGGTKFDEKGFYKDFEHLNAIMLRVAGSEKYVATTKTASAIDFLKALNGINPNAQLHGASGDRSGLPSANNPTQRENVFVQNARLYLKSTPTCKNPEAVDRMGLFGFFGGPLSDKTVEDLVDALNRTLAPLGASVDIPSGQGGKRVEECLDGVGSERKFVALLLKNCQAEGTPFSYHEMRALLAQAVCRMITEERSLLVPKKDSENMVVDNDAYRVAVNAAHKAALDQLALSGGGLKGEELSYSLSYRGGSYESKFTPDKKADFKPEKALSQDEKKLLEKLRSKGAENSGEMEKVLLENAKYKLPLANLARSSVTKNGKTLVSFTRFGQSSFVAQCQAEKNKGTSEYGGIRDAYDDLVTHMVKNDPSFRRRIASSEGKPVGMPIYRIDMTGTNESFMNEKPGSVKNKKLVLDAGYSVNVDVDGKSVEVKPDFQHLKIPMDSDKEGGESKFVQVMDGNLPILRGILETAEGSIAELKQTDPHKAGMIGKLVANIRAYCDRYENARNAEGGNLSFQKFCGADGDAFGVQMMRLGSQTGVLLSLIGDAPAINCNWGRDRTSAMDAMIKQVAIQLDAKENPPNIFRAVLDDKTKALNAKMLFETGNTDVARMTNTMAHNIALNQSPFMVQVEGSQDPEPVHGPRSQSGFIGLYDHRGMGEPAAYTEKPKLKARLNISQKVDALAEKISSGVLKGVQISPNDEYVLKTLLPTFLNEASSENFDQKKENIKKAINQRINLNVHLSKEANPGETVVFNNAKNALAADVYREIMRIRLTDADKNKEVSPVADPKGRKPAEVKELRHIAAQLADRALSSFETNDKIGGIDDFVTRFGTLNRQEIENKFFEALCADPLVRDLHGMPLAGSQGLVEFNPLQQTDQLKYGTKPPSSEGKVENGGDLPVEEGDGKVADRVAAQLIDSYSLYAKALVADGARPDGTILQPGFIREIGKGVVAQTVSLIDAGGNRTTLADEPLKDVNPKDPQFRNQTEVDKGQFRTGYNALVNLKDFFEKNVRDHAQHAYNEILGFVSLALMGPSGISGQVSRDNMANFGFGTPLGFGNLAGNEKLPFLRKYFDENERNVSLEVVQDKDGHHNLVLTHRQELALQFNGIQKPGKKVAFAGVEFGLHKGHCDTVLTIPLDQPSPGVSKGPDEGDGNIANPPKFTLKTHVVPDEDRV